jgi:hypothetical protein
MPEVRLTGKPMAQRIADRLKPSAGDNSGASVERDARKRSYAHRDLDPSFKWA